uniref:Gustatory receptor n=1 Tax=Anopheles minimus TaxID=112268 RepID=A0A182WQI9_9DIPT
MESLEQWFVLSGYVRFYQWLGFQPYRLDSGDVSPFLAHTLVQFCGVVTNLSLIIYWRRCIIYHCDSIGTVVDVIKLLTILFANLIIYGELFRTVGNVCNCWKALHRAHRTLESQGIVDRRQLARTIRLYWLFVIGTLAYLVVNEFYLYFSVRLIQTKRYHVYFFGLQYLLHMKLQQVIYPTIMLDFYLQMTLTALDHHVELLECSDRLGSTRYLEFLARKINVLKRLHSDLFQASVELNEAFGWIYLSIYWKCYIHVLSNLYWVVFWILNDQLYHAARIVNPLLIRTLFIAVMFCFNSRIKNASDRIRHRLHTIDLRIQTRSKPLFTMIESFILQKNLEPIQLTAAGCFSLNFKPILTIVFTVGAYISIFIQQVLVQIPECSEYEARCEIKLE